MSEINLEILTQVRILFTWFLEFMIVCRANGTLTCDSHVPALTYPVPDLRLRNSITEDDIAHSKTSFWAEGLMVKRVTYVTPVWQLFILSWSFTLLSLYYFSWYGFYISPFQMTFCEEISCDVYTHTLQLLQLYVRKLVSIISKHKYFPSHRIAEA